MLREMKCFVCGKSVRVLEQFSDDPAKNCWDGGIVDWMTGGYGSIYDCSRFLVCLCDSCLMHKDLIREPKC